MRHHFHKSAAALTSMEAARLASVLPNPIRFNPTGDQKYVTFRSGLIHSIMVRRGVAVEGFEEIMAAPDAAAPGPSALPDGQGEQPAGAGAKDAPPAGPAATPQAESPAPSAPAEAAPAKP